MEYVQVSGGFFSNCTMADKQFLKFPNKQGRVIRVMKQATARLASLADIFPIWPLFLPFSPTGDSGPTLY